MKKLIYLIIGLSFLCACSTYTAEEKTSEFLSNFEELKLPYSHKYEDIQKNKELKKVDLKFVDLLADTTGKITIQDEESHFELDYFYIGKITTDKEFRVIMLDEYPYPEHEEAYITNKLIIISKSGDIISSIPYGITWGEYDQTNFTTIEINSNLEIEAVDWVIYYGKNNDKPEILQTKKYKIENNGKIALTETIKPEIKEDDLWKETKTSDTKEAYENFTEKFPESAFSDTARIIMFYYDKTCKFRYEKNDTTFNSYESEDIEMTFKADEVTGTTNGSVEGDYNVSWSGKYKGKRNYLTLNLQYLQTEFSDSDEEYEWEDLSFKLTKEGIILMDTFYKLIIK